eukprot:1243088-Pyramimonas_sp.AAC.1
MSNGICVNNFSQTKSSLARALMVHGHHPRVGIVKGHVEARILSDRLSAPLKYQIVIRSSVGQRLPLPNSDG